MMINELEFLDKMEESYQVSLDQCEYAEEYLFYQIAMVYRLRGILESIKR